MIGHRIGLLLITSLLGACATDAGGSGNGNGSGSGEGFSVFPNTTLYSGVESGAGAAQYKVTIAAMNGKGVVWASADASIATVSGTDALGTVTALKAGSTKITATSGGKTVEIPLVVAVYKSSDRAAASSMWSGTCSKGGCHDASGPDVSPSGIGKHTDAQIQATVTMGENPEGGEVSIGKAAHSFAIATDAPAYAGIVAQMRSLPPGTPKQDD